MKKFNIGDLVEIDGSGGAEEYTGLRLFVVGYGETLPVLSFELEAWEKYQEFSKLVEAHGANQGGIMANFHQFTGRNLFGFSEDSLTLVRAANKTVDE